MDKWEFTWVALIPLDQIQEVKDLGDQGWEPFAVTVDEIRGYIVYLRRHLRSSSAPNTYIPAIGTRGGGVSTPGAKEDPGVVPLHGSKSDCRDGVVIWRQFKLQALRHQAWGATSQSCGLLSLPADAGAEQARPVVAGVVKRWGNQLLFAVSGRRPGW